MKRYFAIALICLALAGCSNCDVYGDNDGNKERCWIFQKAI